MNYVPDTYKYILIVKCLLMTLRYFFMWNPSLTLRIGNVIWIRFHHGANTIVSNYAIQNTHLIRVLEMRDLGIVFDRTLSFNFYIDFIVSKAVLWCEYAQTLEPLPFLFRFILFMLDLISNTRLSYTVQITMFNRIESVQKQFYSFLFKKFGYYNVMCEFKFLMLNIEQLSYKRMF